MPCQARLGLIVFLAFWSGIPLGGIYGSQIAKGRFDLAQSLFGIPFLLGTIFLAASVLMAVAGKVEVLVEGNDGLIFTGMGPFGWRRRFSWDDIHQVIEDLTTWSNNGRHREIITLVGTTNVSFGAFLTEPRRLFMLQVLRKMFLRGKPAVA